MQDFLTTLLQCSVSMSLVTLVYAAILPLLSKRYAVKWRYLVWLAIAAGWIFPFRPRIDLSFLHMQMPHIPVTPIQPIISAIPSMTDAGDVGNAPATIPLWWVLGAVWILGAVCVVVYHALRHGSFMKMVRRWSEPVTDSESLEILDSLKSELVIKAQVRLSVCQSISSPMLVGFFRPAILLPPVNIADGELSLILKHELIHFQRRDLWYKALILAATALHWFNPVVYLMAKAAAVQCEISCDALVLQGADFQQRKQYGETIIGVVRNGAKLRTALSTNFYGGKKGMKTRISSIMDTKQKKAGVAVLCVVLVGIMMGGATIAAAASDSQSMPIANYSAAYGGVTENLTADFSQYNEYGLIYDKATNKLSYQGKLVRYFEDFYPLEEGNQAGIDFFDRNGVVDVHALRDLTPIKNSDGSINPAGKLVGLEQSSQEDFDARDISRFLSSTSEGTQKSTSPNAYNAYSSEGMTTPDEIAKVYSIYEPFGLTYDKKQNCLYYNGKLVREFIDILSSNGEALESGKFKGSMRQFNSPDGKGEVDIKAVRDYTKLNADGQGELTGIKVIK